MPKDELIAALEKADGPDRVLDGEIFKATYPERDWHEFEDGWCARDPHDGCAFDVAPAYTASIDAALTLVDDETDPLDIIAQALATAWDERGGVVFLPLHICLTALRATERGEAGR